MLKIQWKEKEVQAAIIAVIGVGITAWASIKSINLTNSGQLEQQRIEDVRDMKRTYYNQLAETFTKKILYSNAKDSIEYIEAESQFLIEASRLPLYASQEMVEFIEDMKDPYIASETSITEFYNIMRKDLCSSSFEEFDGLKELSMSIPKQIIVTELNGNRSITKWNGEDHD